MVEEDVYFIAKVSKFGLGRTSVGVPVKSRAGFPVGSFVVVRPLRVAAGGGLGKEVVR